MGIVSLTTLTNYNSLGNDVNIVGTFSGLSTTKYSDVHVSSPLVNYVEEYEYAGVKKTLFYTEVNTNLKVGDKVFIINGNYDSSNLVTKNKYAKGSDGYKVLMVDKCRIVLDIDYTGKTPTEGDLGLELTTDYVRIYHINSYDKFVTANRQLTTRGGYMGGKFDYYQNNIAFIDYDYPNIQDGWTRTAGITASPGFYVREPAYDPALISGTKGETWKNITDMFMTGTFSLASSYSNPKTDFRYYLNGKIVIVEGNFKYLGTEFTEGNVYKYDSTKGKWVIDNDTSKVTKAVITKCNFRGGDFKGHMYSGLYGSMHEKIKWNGTGNWLGGTLLNTSWVYGSMFSNILLEESYKTTLDRSRKPMQKLNTYNNGGYGFNFVLNSDFENTSIYASIVRNSRFGMTPSLPVVESYVTGQTIQYEHSLIGGLYESCVFNNTSLTGGAVKNSRSKNSIFDGVKHINSWSKDSVLKNTTIISDSIIKIAGYDEWSASEKRGSKYGATFSEGIDFKVYKFYIGESDYQKLKSGDSFYIRGLLIQNNQALLNLFDRKFVLGGWVEYDDAFNSTGDNITFDIPMNHFYKRGVRCGAFLTTPEENEWIYSSVEYRVPTNNVKGGVINGYITDTIIENPNQMYSIDIFVSLVDNNNRTIAGLNFNSPTQSVSSIDYVLPNSLGNFVNYSDAYIIDSNIESGIVDSSVWNSGNDIAYNSELTFSKNDNTLDIITYDVTPDLVTGDITVKTQTRTGEYLNYGIEISDRDSTTYQSDIKVGDILFVSGLDYTTRGRILGITISSTGSGYFDDRVDISPEYKVDGDGYGALIDFTWSLTIDEYVSSVTVKNKGFDYKVGDVLYINVPGMGSNKTGGIDATITVTDVEQTVVRLPDSWKVVNYNPPYITLSPLYGAELIKGLTAGGLFVSIDAKNRWINFTRTKISQTKIKSGLFRRSTLIGNTIGNERYDSSNKDLVDVAMAKSLLLSEITFSNNSNILGPATYHNSALAGGTDKWIDGIVNESVLNKVNISKGTVRNSSWIDGVFDGGIFYQSSSYNAQPLPGKEFYNTNRILSHWMGGKTVGTTSNDRHSWRKGQFNGGEFIKSDWEGGQFNGGNFYASKWYGGTLNGGVFGNETTATSETQFYGGEVNFTTVNNATFVADDTSGTGKTSSIVWNGGIFNSGQFGANENNYVDNTNQSKYSKTENGLFKFDSNREVKLKIEVTNNNITNLLNVELKVDFRCEPVLMVRNTQIYLVSPNGKKIRIKATGIGEGIEMKDTIFSTDKTLPSISISNSPHRGKFSMSFGAETNITNISELFGNNNLNGDWYIVLTNSGLTNLSNIELNNFNVRLTAELTLNPEPTTKTTIRNSAIWNDGIFNGGQFIDLAVWKNGVFNGGKFLSTYGWQESGSYSIVGNINSHTWQGGIFNDGEFGNSSKGANSTWYTGEFNNGTFNGRLWNKGIFRYGTFNGSGGLASGGWNLKTIATSSNAISFVESYTQSFYGLWRSGLVTDANDIFIVDKKMYDEPERVKSKKSGDKSAKFNNILWKSGTFDNSDGQIINSVWQSGIFNKGTFIGGSFNPWIGEFSNTTNTVWNNGIFEDGDFYYSEWILGKFISGTGIGMWFKDGTSNYMNAYNVTWGSIDTAPIWKNGNWYGSEFDYDGQITNPVHTSILDITDMRNKIMGGDLSDINSKKIHIWNVFDNISSLDYKVMGITASTINTHYSTYTPNTDDKIFYPPIIWS